MNINMTLIGQSIAMMVFIWFCMRYIWPPMVRAMEERRQRIAEGLAASEEADKKLEQAKAEVAQELEHARGQASEIVSQAERRATQVRDEAKQEAVAERERQVAAAEAEIQQSSNQARESLRNEVAELVVAGAEKLVGKEIDEQRHRALLNDLIARL